MGLMARKKRKVLRIIEVDERNNRTLKEINIEIGIDTTLEKAKKIFAYNTMFMAKKSEYGKFKFDIITYELDIVDRKDIKLIGAKNYKDKEYRKLKQNLIDKEKARRERLARRIKERRERINREDNS